MKKAKVIIKQNNFNEDGLSYTTKDKGDEGICFTMAIGYAVSVAKRNNVPLKTFNNLVKDIYKETEDVENGEN